MLSQCCKLLNTINDHNSSSQHCDNIYVWDCNGLILRYNYVNCEYSQAIVFYGWGNYYGVKIYGNVFDNGVCNQGGMFIEWRQANATGNNCGPLEVYNNT